MFSDILQVQDYNTTDPYVREIIDEGIRSELNNFGQNDVDGGKTKKGKSTQQQALNNLKLNSYDTKFKYLWGEDNKLEYDYEQDEKKKREKEMQLIEPNRFRVLGYINDPYSKVKNKPILKMSDVYLTSSSKARRIINRVFESHILGKVEPQKTHEAGVIISKSTSNVQQLQQILKNYENQQQDYNFENQEVNMDEQQLEDYVIDRGQSKSQYFLYYKNQQPAKINYHIKNNPLNSQHFLKRLHAEVREKERQYYTLEDIQSEEQSQEDLQETKNKESKKDTEEKKVKEYFGQFRRSTKTTKVQPSIKIEDHFQNKVRTGENIAKEIINYYSYIDNDILRQQYKKSQQENDRLELNLSNPHFFQPKLHAILTREKELLEDSEFKARLAQATKANRPQKSLLSGDLGNFSKMSVHQSEAQGMNSFNEEQNITIQEVINAEIKNISREPIKHSQIATKYEFVKFTLEEDVFNYYHRHYFPFHEHLYSGKVRVEPHYHRQRKVKPNGLVINAQMKESNEKFSHKEDLSCAKGEFILVEYIEETPILMSDVGMCERMFIQVNYLDILSKIREQIFDLKSLEEMEEERDKLMNIPISYRKHSELWRKIIKDHFGENGKQFYWEPRLNTGKVIGVPEGPGVIVMESNLGSVPLVKKKSPTRDYLLVREGKKWVLRKIQNMYVSGQIQPSKRVFCPGSRQHTDFKLAYERAYIVKQIKQYGSVHFDQLKMTFKGETENSLRKALKACNAVSKDSKNFKIINQVPAKSEHLLTPEDICLYERMQKSLCQLKEVGICVIRSNQKMKNVLKVFNKKYYENREKIAISRVIREQLQLTSWYLTDSFLKFKQKASKIEIKGFADPTNGRGGYSFINKPQKERTAKEDMEERQEKQKVLTNSDLRKLDCESSREILRSRGYNEEQIEDKGRWALINMLKSKQGTEYSRKQRETKFKKLQNERKEISNSFNRLLAWLRDETQEPAFDYSRSNRNTLDYYLDRQKQYIEKIRRRYSTKQGNLQGIRQENESEESEESQNQ